MSTVPNEVPKSVSNYFRMAEPGSYTVRIVSDAITGYIGWTADKKPVRSKTSSGVTDRTDMATDSDPKAFWTFSIYNYGDKVTQVWEITQKSIMRQLKALADNPKWGDPKKYDLTITRVGTSMNDTEYSVQPNPKEKFEEVTRPVNLEALYSGGDPFAPTDKEIGEKVYETPNPEDIPF
mgnify:CR=1 FL=1